MSEIQCKTEIFPIHGLNDNELTVGREFLLVCEGEFPLDLKIEKIKFSLKPEEKYLIHFKGLEFRSKTVAEIKVTTYKAGEIRIPDLQLTDGEKTFGVGAVQFNVQSVLPPPQQTQPGTQPAEVKPYGPVGPASLNVPVMYWILLAALFGALIAIIGFRYFRYMQRRAILEKLREHDSALTPLVQFHQKFRSLQRSNTVFFGQKANTDHIFQCLDETHSMFKLFLTRQYQIPALEWSERLILADLKKYHRKVFVEYSDELKKLFNEFERGYKDKEHLKEQDVLNIATHARVLAEKLERLS